MFKIELENRDFRKSLYFYIVDAGKKKKQKTKNKKQKIIRAASGCWHYIKSRANIKWKLEKIWAAGACQRPDHGNNKKHKKNELHLLACSAALGPSGRGHRPHYFFLVLRGACQRPDIYITAIYLKTGVPENPLADGPQT